MTELLNLRKNELDQLAHFLGHGIDVQREYYQFRENITQTVKVVKLLLTMEQGNISE